MVYFLHRPVLDGCLLWARPAARVTRRAFFGSTISNTVCEYFIIFYWLIITPILPLIKRPHEVEINRTHNTVRLHSDGRCSIVWNRRLLSVRNHVQHFYCVWLFTQRLPRRPPARLTSIGASFEIVGFLPATPRLKVDKLIKKKKKTHCKRSLRRRDIKYYIT